MPRFISSNGWAIMSALVLVAGCDRPARESQPVAPKATAPLGELPEITSENEEGFVDLVFAVAEHKTLADGSQSIKAAGRHKGQAVGFEVVLGPLWEGKANKDGRIEMRYGTATFRRAGPESDVFLRVLADLYASSAKPKAMADEREFKAVSLRGNPRDLAGGPVKIKLFFEPGPDDRYAEFYTNIDLAARRLEFREKDPDYRTRVIRALQAD